MRERATAEHAGHGHAPNRFGVLSTPERLGEGEDLRGRGVTIAFLDSGFHPHPDLTRPVDRILAYHDVHDPEASLDPERAPEPDQWHGTQTCVAAAGSGHLSDGVSRGLAPEARLVLVKVGRGGRISDASIEKGLAWALENQKRFEGSSPMSTDVACAAAWRSGPSRSSCRAPARARPSRPGVGFAA